MQNKIIRRRIATTSTDQFASLHPVLRRVYAARGLSGDQELNYQLARLAQPRLKGLEAAVTLLLEARRQNWRILIVGDFDADGATSTAVAIRSLRALGFKEVQFLVPNRFEYGYGLTPEIVDVAAEARPELIVTVDNGIASLEGVARAHELGIKVLVTDHHLPGKELPAAEAIVNPNQPGCEFVSKNAAGVGVIFYLMLALRSAMRDQGLFEGGQEPNLAQFLDLVALGTVADVVPLDYNNRILVSQGIKRMRAGHACAGIRALMEVSGRHLPSLKTSDMGFMVAPRLNAAGRLDDMSLGIRCLLTDDAGEAQALAQELDALNRDRRAIETGMQKEALAVLDSLSESLEGNLPAGVALYRPDWHQGVIGILASRIKDRLHRPVVVFAEADDGTLKGSGRSIAGVHLRDALDRVATDNPGLLTKFGGHAMAAGMSLDKASLEPFARAFAEVVAEVVGEDGLQPVIETDGPLEAADLNLELAAMLEDEGPWGQAFPEPCFDGEFHLLQQKIVGEKHLKMVLAPRADPNAAVDAICFNVDTQLWPNTQCGQVRAAYKLSVNEFRGKRSCQLMVDYLEALV